MIRSLLILNFSAALMIGMLLGLSSCSVAQKDVLKDESIKEHPTIISLQPSSFLCEAKIIGLDTLQSILIIRKMIQQGAALFYSVGIGDTIQAKIYAYQHNKLSLDSIRELVIEERLRLNSEIPDFIIRQIIPEKK